MAWGGEGRGESALGRAFWNDESRRGWTSRSWRREVIWCVRSWGVQACLAQPMSRPGGSVPVYGGVCVMWDACEVARAKRQTQENASPSFLSSSFDHHDLQRHDETTTPRLLPTYTINRKKRSVASHLCWWGVHGRTRHHHRRPRLPPSPSYPGPYNLACSSSYSHCCYPP